MIPLLAIVRIRCARGSFGFWAPLFLVWLILAPLAIAASPLLLIGCAAVRLNPAAAAAGLARVLWSLAGVRVEVDAPGASVLVQLV